MNTDLCLTHLRCEYLKDPLGIETRNPRLSWQAARLMPGYSQTAYQVQLASQESFDASTILHDSGKVLTGESHLVRVDVGTAQSGQRVFWRVRVWDEKDRVSLFSEPAWFEYGLLEEEDWQARWVQSDLTGDQWEGTACPYFRKEFHLKEEVVSARLYITALGLYEAFLNGHRIGKAQLQPGWTDYWKRLHYQVYDITAMVSAGWNAIGAILGDGWYCGRVGWLGRQQYGQRPRLLAQIQLKFADNSYQVIGTGPDWMTTTGPILCSDLLMGEIYDARLAVEDWSLTGADCSGWQPVNLWTPDHPFSLSCSPAPAVHITEELSPIVDPVPCPSGRPGTYLFDLGQNMVGKIRLTISGPSGQKVQIRHGEVLDDSGVLYTKNLRTARQALTYILKGQDREVYTPHFTFMGFRYVEVSGLKEPPDRDMITGLVMHTDLEKTGSFSCSDPLINQLFKNILWSQKGNFLDVPTDCPQRDERLGWTGDAQVFIKTAALTMQSGPFFTKWFGDLEDAQTAEGMVPPVAPALALEAGGQLEDGGPGWADAMVICPWVIYQQYGDRRILEKMYPAMKHFLDYLATTTLDGLRAHPQYDGFRGYGDWLSIDEETPLEVIGTAYYAHAAGIMARAADILGHCEDADRFKILDQQIRDTFITRFLDEAVDPDDLSQTCIVLALQFDLAPEAMRDELIQALVRNIRRRDTHLSCGFLGSPHLPHVLVDHGQADVAYDLLLQTKWPSWLYAVVQGATTIWERWDGWTREKGFQDPGMNSFNHYAYGAVGEWLITQVAGIQSDPDDPGYRNFILRPHPDPRLTFAQGEFLSPYGKIHSAWRFEPNGGFYWDIDIPENSQAEVHIPIRPGWRLGVADGKGEVIHTVDELPNKDTMIYRHHAGGYRFEVVPPRGFV